MASIDLDRDGAVAIMTINNPDKRNAMTLEMRKMMEAHVAEVRDDPNIRALVLTGAGDAFCSGGDISSFGQPIISMRDRMKQQHRVTLSLFYLEKPVIAAVNGVAVGVGFNVALLCDIILASEKAKFSQIFARIGAIPDGGGLYLLANILGMQKAKELVFTTDMISAQEAKELKFIREVYPQEVLMDEAMKLAHQLANGPTRAFGLSKALLHRGLGMDFESFLELEAVSEAFIMQSDDHKAALAAFANKQQPKFKGQ